MYIECGVIKFWKLSLVAIKVLQSIYSSYVISHLEIRDALAELSNVPKFKVLIKSRRVGSQFRDESLREKASFDRDFLERLGPSA